MKQFLVYRSLLREDSELTFFHTLWVWGLQITQQQKLKENAYIFLEEAAQRVKRMKYFQIPDFMFINPLRIEIPFFLSFLH